LDFFSAVAREQPEQPEQPAFYSGSAPQPAGSDVPGRSCGLKYQPTTSDKIWSIKHKEEAKITNYNK